MQMINITRPVLLVRLAVYAPDLQTAWHVYAAIVSTPQNRTFGTMTLDNGEEIDWVDMARGVVSSGEEQ